MPTEITYPFFRKLLSVLVLPEAGTRWEFGMPLHIKGRLGFLAMLNQLLLVPIMQVLVSCPAHTFGHLGKKCVRND